MLLLVLAALIDRAAGLPMVERLRFLAVMERGEAEARRLVVAMASDAYASAEAAVMPVHAAGCCPLTPLHAAGDAALLAARFRMLALAVDAMLTLAGPHPPRSHACWSVSHADRRRHPGSQHTRSRVLRATSPP